MMPGKKGQKKRVRVPDKRDFEYSPVVPAARLPSHALAAHHPPGSEMDERFKKCPWLFRKGNTTGQHRQRRSQVRLRMENLIQRLTNNGDVIVQFFCAVASAQPFTIRVVKELPMTKEQEAVAQGIATPEQKKIARKQRRFIVYRRPYYPSMPEKIGRAHV